jgi:hypothetical protein
MGPRRIEIRSGRRVAFECAGVEATLTEVRLLYSATTLYVGFVCEDDFV